jgi:hypothetical protein
MRTSLLIRRLAIVFAVTLLGPACDRGQPSAGVKPEGEEAAPAAPPAAPDTRPLTEGLAVWRADGFTLLVPEDADIVPREVDPPARWGAILAGPGFLREGQGGALQAGPPAYRVDVATYGKPDTLDLEEWVAARVDERGEAGNTEPVTIPLAGEAAVRTGAGPGETGPASYWLEREGQVVELRLEEEPESPLDGIQRHVQSLILSTFRWSGETRPGR